MKTLRFVLRFAQGLAFLLSIGSALFLFLLPYTAWGIPGGIAALFLPFASQIAAMFYLGNVVNWYVFGLGILASGIAFGAGDLAERCIIDTGTVEPI